MIATIIIIALAIYAIYRLVVWTDKKLSKDRESGIVIKKPKNKEEKKNATTALTLYGQDSKLPILICRQTKESEEKHDKTIILFFLEVIVIVLIAVGLIMALS